MRKVFSRLVPAALILLIVSCPSPDRKGTIPPDVVQPGSIGGSLVIRVPLTNMQADKGSSNDVASYDVSGSGPGNASFQQLGITGSSVTINSLAPGDWGVTVNVNNSKGLQVASATVQVTVVEGETAEKDVAVSPFVGDGTLDVYVQWPAKNAISQLRAALTLQNGALPDITLPAVVITNNVSSVHAAVPFPVGYYTLSVSYLYDGFTWGGAEAVHISSGGTTKLVFTPFDAVKMSIDPDMSNSSMIAFSPLKSVLGLGQTMTVTATPTQMISGKYLSYQWYLNGLPQPEITSTFTIDGKTLGSGNYRLDVVVSANGVLSSKPVLFTIAGGSN